MQRYEFTNCLILFLWLIGADKTAIYEIDVHLTSRYMNETFESCSEVIMPSTGQLALDASCGIWGAKQCTPQR